VRNVFEANIATDHPIVANHRVLDRPVLPGLAYIDMLYQLARQALQANLREYSLQRMSILHPLLVDTGTVVRLKIAFDRVADGWDIAVDGTQEGAGPPVVHSYITAQLRRETFVSTRRIDIEVLKRASSRKLDMASIYAAAAKRGLVHTGLIRAQGEIFVSERGCLVDLAAQREDGPHGLLFHPAIIDGAAMAAEALRPADDPSLFLPLYYDAFSCGEPLGSRCFALIEAASVRSVNDIHSLDIGFYDGSGREIAVLRGMTSKRVRQEAPLGTMGTTAHSSAVSANGSHRVAAGPTTSDVTVQLQRILGRHLDMPAVRVDPGAGFFALGLQSAQMLSVLKEIEASFDLRLSPTLLFEHANVGDVADYLQGRIGAAYSVGRENAGSSAAAVASAGVSRETRQLYTFHSTDGLLRDHLVYGTPALMGVAHACMALDLALATQAQTLPVMLEQITFTGGPITPDEQGRIEVQVRLCAPNDALEFRTDHTSLETNEVQTCCTGRFATPAAEVPAQIDVAALIASAQSLSPTQLQRLYAGVADFTIGSTLRTIFAAYAPDASTLVTRVSLAGKAGRTPGGSPYVLDPLLLNACYFLRSDAAQPVRQRIVVPVAIERMTVFSAVPERAVIITHMRRGHAGFLAFDATIYSDHGECLVQIHNASLNEVADPSLLTNARFAVGPRVSGQRARNVTTMPAATRGGPLDIAIIGLSGRYPKADDLDAFWDNLREGRDCITEIPADRWDWRDYHGPDGAKRNRIISKWGGFIDGVDQFAPLFFGISPREAAVMDPQERLFLEHCWLALEDAGHTRDSIGASLAATSRQVGVYVGVMSQEYALFATHSSQHAEPIGLPTGVASIANRVSFYFDFHGPSVALDTMCSSSLTAITMACDALRDGRIDAAMAGGVNVSVHPNKYLMLSEGGFLSSKGRCESFGLGGDGYIPGEGVGVAVLKRLADAERDGDQIYGVIKGAQINHGGRASGYTVPSPSAQADVVARAWEQAGADARLLGYIEAHGTGTSLGDPIEIAGLAKAFEGRIARQCCAIGSVKSNIGHCESAAGIAGLTKVLLQFRHQQIAPSLHSGVLNPHIDFADSSFVVPQSVAEWPRPRNDGPDGPTEHARLAGVSSFGAGGANAHLVIQEYVDLPTDYTPQQERPAIIVLSAKSVSELHALAQRLCASLERGRYTAADFVRIAYTLQLGREAMIERLAVVAESLLDLCPKLQAYLRSPLDSTDGVFRAASGENARLLARVAHDEDMASTIAAWARKGKYDKLAELWVSGAPVDWNLLYGAHRPKRIGLPGYPFARERCWIGAVRSRLDPLVQPDTASFSEHSLSSDTRATLAIAPSCVGKERTAEAALFEPAWVAEPAEVFTAQPATHGGKCHVCFISDHRHQSALARAIEVLEPGCRLMFVGRRSTNAEFSAMDAADQYIVELDDRASYERAFAGIKEQVGSVDSLLYLWPLEDPDAITTATPLFTCLQSLATIRLPVKNVLLAGESTGPASLEACHLESWIGLARSMKFVFRGTRFTSVLGRTRLDSQSASRDWATWARYLWQELRAGGSDAVLYDDGVRYTQTLRPLESVTPKSAALPLKQRGTYLITGGLGGLGLVVASELAQAVAANLILIGRSALNAAREAALDRLRACGGRVTYVQADVCDEVTLRAAVTQVQHEFGDIHGVIHAAGVSNGTPFARKLRHEFERVLAPKISGTLVLDQVLRAEPLDFMCYFGSTSAVLGDLGVGDYDLANRFQLAYAACRRQRDLPGRSVAIAWPLWSEGGLEFGTAEARATYLKTSGQRELESEEGIALMYRLLAHGAVQAVVLTGNLGRVAGTGTPVLPREPLHVAATAGRRQEMRGLTLQQCVEWDLRQVVSELLHIPRHKLSLQANLADFGFDSMTLQDFASRLSELFGDEIMPTLFFSHPSLSALSEHFVRQRSAMVERLYGGSPSEAPPPLAAKECLPSVPSVAATRPASVVPRVDPATELIAIIGMSGRFPGARDVEEMWEVLVQGRDTVTEIPPDRFDWRAIYAADAVPGDDRTNCKWGGTIEGAAQFDALFFEVSPREAAAIDPRQRLLLQEAYKALEDAAYGAKQLKRSHIGMFVGAEPGGYGSAATEKETITANHDAILASRLAHFLDLSGPVMAINTACSSGLVAAHQACMSLRNRECDTAIAAAVNLLLIPESFVGMSRAGMLSPDGRCHAFAGNANGMVPGEAVVAVVLKRLADAEADGDPIHAVVRGSGINYDGRTNGITAPSGLAQVRLLASIHERYHVDADEIGYVVAHGTGTPLGDPVEVNALCEAFRARTQRRAYCALTSTKTNFGHTFAASGLVSLVSLVQALRHKTLPPSLHCAQPSQLVAWADSPFYINTTAAPWRVAPAHARVGAVSAFGMSGTNSHMVLEEYEAPPTTELAGRPSFLLTLSAKQPQALVRRAHELAAFLEATLPRDLTAISHTLLNGRLHFRHRCAAVVRDVEDAIGLLRQVGAVDRPARLFVGTVTRDFVGTPALQRYGDELIDGTNALRGDAHKCDDALSAFADLYCQGYDLDWSRLFGARAQRRVHLPTYPFATDRYWIERKEATIRAETVTPGLDKPPAAVATDSTRTGGLDTLSCPAVAQLIADQLGVPLAQLDEDVPLDEYGLDSIGATFLIGRIRSLLPAVIESLFLEYPTLGAIQRHLAEKHAVEIASVAAKADIAQHPLQGARATAASTQLSTHAAAIGVGAARVAVIGIAGQFPGAATIEEFWSTLTAGRPATGPMPQRRRQLLGLCDDKPHCGGYLDGIEYFDHERFKLSRDEAKAMDPQLRKLIETVWAAIADAGYGLPEFKTGCTALYVATRGQSGYRDIPAYVQGGGRAAGEAEGPGLFANRVSNLMDLRGPSQSVDTGCSSYLVALRHALADLREGRCVQAIVATAQMTLSPNDYVDGSTFALHTKTGATRSFAKDSDGYLRSEVVGAIVLKLEDTALADGDALYCTLRSVGVHHGGKSPLKWYSPNVEGQKVAIEEALRAAAIDAADVDYVEAEANGSQLGDASEIVSLQSVYGRGGARSAERALAISSLKPVYGHAEAGSTFPALLKVILSLRECRIPGIPGLGELNENIQLAPGFEILGHDRAWPRRTGPAGPLPRLAAVHSLALGGVNAHLLVEESLQSRATRSAAERRDYVLVFSDRTPELLRETVSKWVGFFSQLSVFAREADIGAIAYTLQVGRVAERFRLAVVADSIDGAMGLLEKWLEGALAPARVFVGEKTGGVGGPSKSRSSAPGSESLASDLGSPGELAKAWAAGLDVNWRALHEGKPRQRRVHLPPNALRRVYCWHDEVASEAPASAVGVLLMRPQWVKSSAVSAPGAVARPNRIVFCGWPPQRGAQLGKGLDVLATVAAGPGAPAQHCADHFKDVFHVIKQWLTCSEAGRACLQIVIPNGLENVCLHALVGLIRTARREHSRFIGQLIVLDHAISAARCREILTQDARCPEDVYIQHMTGQHATGERWVQSWHEVNADELLREQPASAPGLFRSTQPVVLITGGGGALGLIMAQRLLADEPRAAVFLAGRSALNAAQESVLEKLRAGGRTVRYRRTDVSDRHQVQSLMDEIRSTAGDCSGILHCAGAIRDAHIINKPVEDLEPVLGPKVAGLWHLDEATKDMPLEFFAAFSSTAAIFGNAGQADYAMANAFMDAFAGYRNQLVRFGARRGRTISINWPLWAEGGMPVGAAAKATMAQRYSMFPLPSELGARIALGCLGSGETNIAVTYGRQDRLRRDLSLGGRHE
jgi:acyl transferase domain-containing protein